MISSSELLQALGTGNERADGPTFAIRAGVGPAHVARNQRGRACLLLELHHLIAPVPIGRITGALSLTFATSIEFELGARQWKADCAIVECLDDEFLGAFCVLALDLAGRFGAEPPVAQAVAAALAEWERLFRCRRRLTEKEELGLWAELSFIARMPSVDSAVRAWRGPYGGLTDFFGGGVGIECKASRLRLRHHIAAAQASRPRGEHPTYVVSMWVDVDASRGQALAEVVQEIGDRTTESVSFEKALLAAGYARSDGALYSARFALLEDAHWFAEAGLPRIRAADPGVLEVQYVIQLDEDSSLSSAAIATIVDQFNA